VGWIGAARRSINAPNWPLPPVFPGPRGYADPGRARMSPLGPLAVAAAMLFFLALRWRGLAPTGRYSLRAESPYWLFAAGAVALSVVVTVAGRVAMLVVTPFILVPAGIYLLQLGRSGVRLGDWDIALAGWAAVAGGVLAGIAALAMLASR
jgi:hypothetical protein